MTWILLGLVSAFFLGLYDIVKKRSVKGNAVLPVLFISTVAAALLWLPFIVLSQVSPDSFTSDAFFVHSLSLKEHLQLFLKSFIVAASWVFSYFALKHLPVSIAGTIRATSPLWVLGGAVLLFQERPNVTQWIGIAITLIAFLFFSLAGKLEGITFHKNKWVFYMIMATLIGSVSALYDKYLLTGSTLSPSTVQAWFSVYLVIVLLPLIVGWWKSWWPRGQFHWRWSIPLIGIALLLADYAYFTALKDDSALIAVLSCIRRGNVLISFSISFMIFKEVNFKQKAPCLLGILIGIWIIVLGGK